MEVKSVLMPYLGHDDETAALKTALALVAQNRGRLDVIHVSPEPADDAWLYTLGYLTAPHDPASVVTQVAHLWPEMRALAERKFRMAAAEAKVQVEDDSETPGGPCATFFGTTGSIGKIVAKKARAADLTVITRPPIEGESGYRDAAYGALFHSGRPVLLVPPGLEPATPGNKALIAWNGSAEAARAVALALPMLRRAKVWIYAARPPGAWEFPVSARALARYLRGHGIIAETLEPEVPPADLPAMIERTARTLDAGMIVMGAYGHGRFRETVFGGLTDSMLHGAKIPVFMAH